MIVMRSLRQESWNQLWTFFFFKLKGNNRVPKRRKTGAAGLDLWEEKGGRLRSIVESRMKKRRRKWRKDGRSRGKSERNPRLQVRKEREQGQPHVPSSWGIWPLGTCAFASWGLSGVAPRAPSVLQGSLKSPLWIPLFFFGRFCLPNLSAPGLRTEPSIYILKCERWMWTSPTLPCPCAWDKRHD